MQKQVEVFFSTGVSFLSAKRLPPPPFGDDVFLQATWLQHQGSSTVIVRDVFFVGNPVHQTFQVPKMEVLNLIRLFLGWGFPYMCRTTSEHVVFNADRMRNISFFGV